MQKVFQLKLWVFFLFAHFLGDMDRLLTEHFSELSHPLKDTEEF